VNSVRECLAECTAVDPEESLSWSLNSRYEEEGDPVVKRRSVRANEHRSTTASPFTREPHKRVSVMRSTRGVELGDSSGTDIFVPWWLGVREGQAAGDDEVPGRVGAAASIQPQRPSVWLLTLERRPRRPAPTCSAWETSQGPPKAPLGQGLRRGSPLTTGVITGDGQYC
jgi:hypothetical protein